jgi:hypothetical protein
LPLVLDRFPAEGGDYLSIFFSEFLWKIFGRDSRQVPQISLSQPLADAAGPYQCAYGEVQLLYGVPVAMFRVMALAQLVSSADVYVLDLYEEALMGMLIRWLVRLLLFRVLVGLWRIVRRR